jgi:hypothetical protein
MLVTQRKCAKTLSLRNSPVGLSNLKNMGGSVSVIPEFLQFYPLLHAAYAW